MSDFIRSAALASLPEVARRHGLDALELLREAGIPSDCLEDPERMLPVERAYRMLERAARLAGAGSLGLEMAEANRISTLGLLGLILREEPTLRDALGTLLRYRRIHNESLLLALEQDHAGPQPLATLRMALAAPAGTPVVQATEQGIGMLLRSLRSLLGAQWKPRLVCLVNGPVGARAVYQRVLNAPLQFHADFNGLVFHGGDLALPLRTADPALVRQARAQLEQIMLQRGAVSCAQRVQELVRVLLPAGRCSADHVALHLGMHRRTLHRHLLKEGQSFDALLEQVRRELAVQLVNDTRRPLSQVSDLLGFSAPPAFSRWHRQVFGASPRGQRMGVGTASAAASAAD